MPLLIAGLIVFLGTHSLRIAGDGPRARLIGWLGENGYKGLYSIASFVGIALLAYGYGAARLTAPLVYVPPVGLRHLALLLVPIGLVAVTAAYTPPGRIRAHLRHPMVVGVALWAAAHLMANGTLADVLLFGGFLVWALADYLAARRREPRPVAKGTGWSRGDTMAILIGLGTSAALLLGVHQWLFGVSPLI